MLLKKLVDWKFLDGESVETVLAYIGETVDLSDPDKLMVYREAVRRIKYNETHNYPLDRLYYDETIRMAQYGENEYTLSKAEPLTAQGWQDLVSILWTEYQGKVGEGAQKHEFILHLLSAKIDEQSTQETTREVISQLINKANQLQRPLECWRCYRLVDIAHQELDNYNAELRLYSIYEVYFKIAFCNFEEMKRLIPVKGKRDYLYLMNALMEF